MTARAVQGARNWGLSLILVPEKAGQEKAALGSAGFCRDAPLRERKSTAAQTRP
jgi:hypothetical protein